MEFLALLALVFILLITGGLRFVLVTSAVWLAASVFNPPLESSWVWFIAAVASATASLSRKIDVDEVQS